ncbi:nitric oxide reductase transcriptional regulator NorR [Cupriavidus gilardii]|nr:nitric oxide reductase transcriptional regulator NorR [Cupriavidus gilardii]
MTTNSDFPTPADEGRFRQLLAAARGIVRCDAAALLRLQGEVLVPVAVHGLSDDALGRRFPVSAHPRLAQLLDSEDGVRFAADCGLPDPYDGLIEGQPDILPIHDCMGAPLHCGGRLWGLVTLDALQPGAFADISAAQMQAVVTMLESGIEADETIRALAERAAREREMSRALQARGQPRELLGKSAAMKRLKQEIDTVAASDLSVLILGETGVGKELVAQRLHDRSARRDRPLVQINCAALPETLADSELFGHKRGAFTGAVQDRVGKFELADGGTLFLDEVGELPLPVQAKLLRVLQSGEVQRPGSDRLLRVDVRVLAATNRDLGKAVAEGRFRADLYHRLSVYPLRVPPLRERGRDVLALAGGFLEENQHRLGARNLRLSPDAALALMAYAWPGNVRELEHLISRAALRALAESRRGARWIAIEPRHLGLDSGTSRLAHGNEDNEDVRHPSRPTAAQRDDTPAARAAQSLPASAPEADRLIGSGTLREATDEFQRRWIEAVLARHGGAYAAAARAAGMDRSNFHRLARRLGVAPEARRQTGRDADPH